MFDNDHAPAPQPIDAARVLPDRDAVVVGDRRAMLAGLMGVGGLAAGALFAARATAGPLDPPPGPVTSTGKPLTDLEPRIAINDVNTPGDASSVYRITQSGSYYLTGHVTGISGRHGIAIAANNVTVDLNGYSLLGVPGSLNGITALGSVNRMVIRNGIARNWGGHGVSISSANPVNAIIEGVIASTNGGQGISAGRQTVVRDCCVRENGSHGLVVGIASVVTRCSAEANTGDGFRLLGGSHITACVASANQGHGLFLGRGSLADRCCVNQSAEIGIYVEDYCILSHNTISGSLGIGVQVVRSVNYICDNICQAVDDGFKVDQGGNFIVRNVSVSFTRAWNIAAGNVVGPILDRRSPGGGSISGFSAPDTTGTTHPWANFSL